MPHRKVTIVGLTNEANRRSTHKRRSDGLIKKVQELSTLCNVPACVVIYDIGNDNEPKAWPSLLEATKMMQAIMDMPESSKRNRMLDSEGLLQQNIAKAEEKLLKKRTQNRRLEIFMIMNDIVTGRRKNLDDLDPKMIDDLEWVLRNCRQEIQKHVTMLQSEASTSVPAAAAATCKIGGIIGNANGDA